MLSGLDIFYSVIAPVFRHAAKKILFIHQKTKQCFHINRGVIWRDLQRQSNSHIPVLKPHSALDC